MKKGIFKIIPIACIALYSCNNDPDVIDKPIQQTNPEVQYRTNVEEAIYYASKEMEKYTTNGKKGVSTQVESVFPIVKPNYLKKSTPSQDTLLYLINYKEKGFAITGAQKYTDQIFAISTDSHFQIADTANIPPLRQLINAYAEYVRQDTYGKKRHLSNAQSHENMEEVLYYLPPLIDAEWDQRSGFEELYPRNEPAGCVPVALGMFCYYHKMPSTVNGYTFDWDLMHNIKKPIDMLIQKDGYDMVQRLLYESAKIMGTKNGQTYTTDLVSCMKSYGFSYAYLLNFDPASIKWSMLARNVPFIMIGTSSTKSGHAWIVDGYRETITKTWNYELGFYIERENYLFHCNWGWGGTANGFYKYWNERHFYEFDLTNGPDWGRGTSSSYVFTDGFQYIDY